jgi:hypothetical protein
MLSHNYQFLFVPETIFFFLPLPTHKNIYKQTFLLYVLNWVATVFGSDPREIEKTHTKKLTLQISIHLTFMAIIDFRVSASIPKKPPLVSSPSPDHQI